MSGSALMSLGMRALFANYSALQTTGNNISNANTKGYSKQAVELESAGGQFSGAGFFGKGVNVTTVSRAHDEFLTREAATTSSQASSDAARSDQLKQLETVFGTGENGVGYASGQFLNAFVDVANNPQDLINIEADWAKALSTWADRHTVNGKRPLLDEAQPEFERVLIRSALKRTQGHRQEAARLLGWGRNTLTRKLKELGMDAAE